MAGEGVQTRRFSRAEYERLIELGVFQPGERLELIGGQLLVAEPQGSAHYTAIRKTAQALESAFGARAGRSGHRAPSASTTSRSRNRISPSCPDVRTTTVALIPLARC